MKQFQLNHQEISERLQEKKVDVTVQTPKVVTSTNDLAKEIWFQQPESWTLVATNKQTAGRGRQGKKFYSSLAHGLYFSLAFKPNAASLENVPMYTILAAAAVVETLAPYLETPLSVKWVNDLFYKGRKVSGILSELVMSQSPENQTGIIVGIGINISGTFQQADDQTQTVAGTLFGEETPDHFNQNEFLADFLQCFYAFHEQFEQKEFMKIYETHLMGIGQTVTYMEKNEAHEGVILGIDDQGYLNIRKSDQTIETLYGQPISFGSDQFIEQPE